MSASFPLLSYEQSNPLIYGEEIMQKIRAARLLNDNQEVANQYQPKTMEEALRKAKLDNALSDVKLQYAPQNEEANLGETRAKTGLYGAQSNAANANARNTNFLTDNPLLNQTGPAGQIGALQWLMQHPELMNKKASNDGGGGQVMPSEQSPQQQPNQRPDMSYWDKNPPQNPLAQLFQQPGNNQPQQPSTMGNIGNSSPQQQNGGESMADLPALLQKSIFTNLRRQNANTDLTEKKANNYSFNSLPMDHKNAILSKAGGMGIDPAEAQERYNKGQTIEDMATEKGFDPNNLPEAIYPSTKSDIKRIHDRQTAFAELETLQPLLTEAMAPYAQRFNGYSPKQIIQMMSGEGKDEDQIAKFLAARQLNPEYNAVRLKVMSGQVGIEALREVEDASASKFKILESEMSPSMFRKMNNIAADWIGQGVKAANRVGLNPEKAQNKSEGQSLSNSSDSGMMKVQAPDGKVFNVPSNQVEALLKDHPDHKRID